jgi:hypothetical protein
VAHSKIVSAELWWMESMVRCGRTRRPRFQKVALPLSEIATPFGKLPSPDSERAELGPIMGHEIGTLEVGEAADLVAFEADPTTDASAFSRVAAVFLGRRRMV